MQGRATEQNGRQFRALRNDALDPCLNGRKHRILKMQIVYRVRGDVEFGKQDQISALVTGKARQIERGIDIRLNVARAGLRRCRCDADQTVSVNRSEARRVGKECVMTGRYRCAPDTSK